MHREGGHAGLLGEASGCAVSLMHIQIHHQHALGFAVVQQHLRCGGDVIENAEAAAEIGVGVMGASGQMAGDAMAKGQSRR